MHKCMQNALGISNSQGFPTMRAHNKPGSEPLADKFPMLTSLQGWGFGSNRFCNFVNTNGVDNIIDDCQQIQRLQKQLVLMNCCSCCLVARKWVVTAKKISLSCTQTYCHFLALAFPDCRRVTQMDNMYFSPNVSHYAPKLHIGFIYGSNN